MIERYVSQFTLTRHRCAPYLWRSIKLFFLMGMLACFSLHAEDGKEKEYAIKGAFLFNFTKFIEWPEVKSSTKKTSFVIGIMGEDPFGKELDNNLADRTIGGHKVKIERLKETDTLNHVDVLFVNLASEDARQKILEQIKDDPILTVGEAPEFCSEGGVIRFIMVDKKVRFEINQEAAKKKKLVINVELLKLSRSTKKKTSKSDSEKEGEKD